MLLGLEAKDIDVACGLPPEEVMRRARMQGLKVIATGIEHGTVTIMVGDEPIEVTTFRKDVSTDGRNATVEWAKTIEEDLSRRDFTINAMAMDSDGNIIDPHYGQYDLRDKKIITVGTAAERFTEDALRPIRGARFATRFGFAYGLGVDPFQGEALWWTQKNLDYIMDNVSIERIVDEINKTFVQAEDPTLFLKWLELSGLLGKLSTELGDLNGRPQSPEYHPEGNAWVHTMEVVARTPRTTKEGWAYLRWAALLHDIGKATAYQLVPGRSYYKYHGHAEAGADIITALGTTLKLPNWLTEVCAEVCRYHMHPLTTNEVTDKARRRFQAAAGEHLESIRQIHLADVGTRSERKLGLFEELPPEATKPALMGRHLIAKGHKPGPWFKSVLQAAFDIQLDTGITDVEILYNKVKDLIPA